MDFNGLGMGFHVLRRLGRSESVSLTMPRMSLKSDGRGRAAAAPAGAASVQTREVRKTITVNSAIATTTISDPTIGAAIKDAPFKTTMATPTGNRTEPMIWSQPCAFASVLAPAAGTRKLKKCLREKGIF
jgi:hypothetical protein